MSEEFINKIELKGIVGSIHDDPEFYRLGICVQDTIPTDEKNFSLVDITWFDCLIDKAHLKGTPTKGSKCHLFGRMKSSDYMSSDGKVSRLYQVVCTEGTVEPKKES